MIDTATVQRIIDVGAIRSGDVLSFRSKGILGAIIALFAGNRSHVGMIFKRPAGWMLYEYGFEIGKACGAFVTPLLDRLAAETGRAWLHRWAEPWTAGGVQAGLDVWQADIDGNIPYGLDMLAQFAPWLTAIAFYRTGFGRFMPWAAWRLEKLLAHPPAPLLHADAEVCSTEVAHAAKAAGRFDGNPDSQTPLMVSRWPGFLPEAEL